MAARYRAKRVPVAVAPVRLVTRTLAQLPSFQHFDHLEAARAGLAGHPILRTARAARGLRTIQDMELAARPCAATHGTCCHSRGSWGPPKSTRARSLAQLPWLCLTWSTAARQ